MPRPGGAGGWDDSHKPHREHWHCGGEQPGATHRAHHQTKIRFAWKSPNLWTSHAQDCSDALGLPAFGCPHWAWLESPPQLRAGQPINEAEEKLSPVKADCDFTRFCSQSCELCPWRHLRSVGGKQKVTTILIIKSQNWRWTFSDGLKNCKYFHWLFLQSRTGREDGEVAASRGSWIVIGRHRTDTKPAKPRLMSCHIQASIKPRVSIRIHISWEL